MKTSGLLKLHGMGELELVGLWKVRDQQLLFILVLVTPVSVNKYTCGKLTRTQKASRKILRMRTYGQRAIGRQRNQPNRVID